MVSLMSRQGRQLQRYSRSGCRLVVGCIPYKFNVDEPSSDDLDQVMEVLVISSQKGYGMMFPKGGWETDETIEQAALREALEEAGVQGNVERKLGRWRYKSKTNDAFHEGIMFPMNVTEVLVDWPEMDVRERRWVSVAEAKQGCDHLWMREALERLVTRLSNPTGNRAISTPGGLALYQESLESVGISNQLEYMERKEFQDIQPIYKQRSNDLQKSSSSLSFLG